jgi:hypothetical protein
VREWRNEGNGNGGMEEENGTNVPLYWGKIPANQI